MQKKHVLQDMLEPVISGLGYETVRILTIGKANPTLQIMIDKLDGSDIVVEDCATVSRKISEVLDANDPIKDKYNLEVSSPGLDRPLTKPAHFARFAGYEAKVETDEAIENRKRFKGKITGLDEENKVHLEMDGREYVIPFDAVSKAKIVITDELLQKYVDEHPECGEHVIEE